MPLLVVGNEHDFGALRDRLFGGPIEAAAADRAQAAIAAANPGIDLAALKPGLVLTIPDVPEIPDRGPLSLDASVHGGVDGIANNLENELAALREESARAAEEARAERKATVAAFDDDLVRRATAGDERLAAALDAARSAIAEEDEAAGKRQDALAHSIGAWSAEIEALRKLAG